MNGYMFFERNNNNMCEIASYASYPIVTNVPTNNINVTIKNFLIFGPGVGDSILTKADDSTFGPFSISQTIPYLNSYYSNYYICINGWIGSYSTRLIYPFNVDLDTRYSGNIFYRQLNSTDLNNVKTDINKVNSTFIPSSGFVVTWYQVPRYGGLGSSINYTFQAIVISNGNQTYLVYNYDDQAYPIQWSSSNTGFDNGNGINLFDGSSSIVMANASNINVNGKWVFKVDTGNYYPSPSNYSTVTPSSTENTSTTIITTTSRLPTTTRTTSATRTTSTTRITTTSRTPTTTRSTSKARTFTTTRTTTPTRTPPTTRSTTNARTPITTRPTARPIG